jgi:alpha-D-ribose 1-methylphosphonate 5-phosphate C-P lyase
MRRLYTGMATAYDYDIKFSDKHIFQPNATRSFDYEALPLRSG